MTSLIYNTQVKAQITSLRSKLPHALLLHGPPGVGLLTAARDIAGSAVAEIIQPTDKTGASDATGSIKIEQIRHLYEITRGKSSTPRVFVIDDADRMVAPAQHAFLKLLEEPAPHIHFVLTAHSPNKLLPTILSRVQQTRIPAISVAESKKLLNDLGVTQPGLVQQILFLASGRPALMTKYATDPALLTAKASSITDARTLLSGTIPEKLRVIQHYSVDRSTALGFLESAIAIVTYSLGQNPSAAHISLAERLAQAYDRIAANGTVRLNLLLIVL